MAFKQKRVGEVVLYQSENLAVPHGFSTRFGGVSKPSHLATMNFGFGRGEEDGAVLENYRRFTEAADLSGRRLLSAEQIHSDQIFFCDGDTVTGFAAGAEGELAECCSQPLTEPLKLQGDAFVTSSAGVSLCVKIADCVPILLHEPKAKLVAAVHAGWRGTAADIVGKTVAVMKRYGAECSEIRAAIGPCIHHGCYEVGGDMVQCCREQLGETLCSRFFYPITEGGKLHCDLPGLNKALLHRAGVLDVHIEESGLCTSCHNTEFFSHRASSGKRGTMVAMIGLNKA